MESFVFEQQVLFRVNSLFDLQPHGLVPNGDGERCHNLDYLRLFLLLIFLNGIIQFKHQPQVLSIYLGMTYFQ